LTLTQNVLGDTFNQLYDKGKQGWAPVLRFNQITITGAVPVEKLRFSRLNREDMQEVSPVSVQPENRVPIPENKYTLFKTKCPL